MLPMISVLGEHEGSAAGKPRCPTYAGGSHPGAPGNPWERTSHLEVW